MNQRLRLFCLILVFIPYCLFAQNEIGSNDFPISNMGTAGSTDYEALGSAIAYNSTNNEYLVVWYADDDSGSLVNGEYEIYGQRLNSSGAAIGAVNFRISDMGPDGNASYDATNPAVAYNSMNNEYLVVWTGDDNIAPLAEGNVEVFGQRLSNMGAEIGTNDFRISELGGDVSGVYFSSFAEVAYNVTDNEYLVVWQGEDNTAPLVNNELEIFGQRLSNMGAEVGDNDFRISDMGPDGNANYDALTPSVAYNGGSNEYLVVWEGNDGGSLHFNEKEIYGQRLTNLGVVIGDNDFRISDMGTDGDGSYDAYAPSVAYNSDDGEYLVVWDANDNNSDLASSELEIYGQRLTGGGVETGTNDFRISDMGPDGDGAYTAFGPAAVTYNAFKDEYLVVWRGDDNNGTLVNNENEVFGQRLTNMGVETGVNDFRISDMGPDGNSLYGAFSPSVIDRASTDEYLVVWEGDDTESDTEIFGQRVNSAVVLPVELLHFSAEQQADLVILKWQTATEINNLGFEIQRSTDGRIFEKIGWQVGQGSTQIKHDYIFQDPHTKNGQTYYYRLQQIDWDGSFTYSNVETLQMPNESSISVYPNPFQDAIFLKSTTRSNPLLVNIYNQYGQILYAETMEANVQKLSISHLPKGIYQVVIWKNGTSVFREMIVKH